MSLEMFTLSTRPKRQSPPRGPTYPLQVHELADYPHWTHRSTQADVATICPMIHYLGYDDDLSTVYQSANIIL